jgi:hypothetical protein
LPFIPPPFPDFDFDFVLLELIRVGKADDVEPIVVALVGNGVDVGIIVGAQVGVLLPFIPPPFPDFDFTFTLLL